MLVTERTLSILRNSAISLALFAVTVALYAQTLRHPFTNCDDPAYVTQNRHVQQGVTPAGVAWAFTTGHAANWHPLTWLSHMLDCQLFGLNPSGHHLTSFMLHAVNTVLLFLALTRMTKAPWRSAAVAALFAWHPAHVESVVWVAERKDVLSALFGIACLGAYSFYAERPSLVRYIVTLTLFALGLLAKPMLVTLPFVFLLLDWWPLNRVSGARDWRRTVYEKLPFLALAVASCVVTVIVQRRGGALMDLAVMPVGARMANALVSYLRYVTMAFVPTPLAVYYPRPLVSHGAGLVTAAAAFLIAVTVVVLFLRRKAPYLGVGWFWFVGMLVPVIGIVQVGNQAMANRYTYLPLIGVFVMVVWGAVDLGRRFRHGVAVAGVAGALALAILLIGAAHQIRYWKDDITLFRHALAVTKDNAFAHNNLGYALAGTGALDEAFREFAEAARIDPVYVDAYYNLGVALMVSGQYPAAAEKFQIALKLRPKHYDAWYNLGAAYTAMNRFDDAVNSFENASIIDPAQAEGHTSLARVYAAQGRNKEAVVEFDTAIRLGAADPDVYAQLGAALAAIGDTARASDALDRALRLNPNHQAAAELLKKIR